MRRFLFAIPLLLICICNYGQEIPQFLFGQIKSSAGSPVSHATILFMDKNQKVTTYALCNETGSFMVGKIPAGTYTIHISCVGYESLRDTVHIEKEQIDLGVFMLKEGLLLEEAVVKGWSMIELYPDRIVYDVEQDSTAKNSVAMQIFEKIPFVTIDKATNQLQVMGENNFTITINGKKSLFLSETNQYVARLLEANKMKQVELLISPQGKYSDKTAVINIVTQGSLPDGIVGNITADFNHEFIRPNFNLTSKIKKFIYNLTYIPEYSYYHKLNSFTETINYLDEDIYRTTTNRREWSKDDKQKVVLNASYDFSDRDLLTLSGSYSYYRERLFANSEVAPFDKGMNLTHFYRVQNRDVLKNRMGQATLNYQRSSQKNPERLFTATYTIEHQGDKNKYRQNMSDSIQTGACIQRSLNNLDLTEQTVGVDYYHPIDKKHAYFLTGKAIFRNYGSDGHTQAGDETVPKAMEELSYDQYVYSVRANYSFKHKKIMIIPQISLEVTDNNMKFDHATEHIKKQFFSIAPQIVFTYQINSKSLLTLGYSVPSFRPDIYYLNPFVNDSDPSHIIVGNPDLKPENSHVMNITYNFFTPKLNFNLNTNYKYSGNAIHPYDYINDDRILTTTYGNISTSNIVTLNMNLNYKPHREWETWLKAQAKYSKYSYADNNYPLWNFEANGGMTFNMSEKCYAQALGWLTPLSTSTQNTKFQYFVGYALRLGYHLNKKLLLQAEVEKFFRKHLRGKEEKQTSTFYYYKREELYGRTLTLSFSYNFGRFKQQVKQSKRAILNSDRSKSE